ncbi:cathepsin L-like proteinase [Diorhabda sublineata]|uniref:cathepsin L-like proteinase n=1 Tax=Diorhabda sublineata TaxID=1163346 RepID=UPI0024E065E6|nr:cathepsin L-like proteinase [Diorhabda sublineata]
MKFLFAVSILVATTTVLARHDLWAEFKVKFNREYELLEDKLRFQIFQKNFRLIEEHNDRYAKGEVSYFLKVTKFADWTEEELSNMFKRQSALKPEINNTGIFKANPNLKIPDSIDWRESNAVLPVRNQGICGACWSFSTTGCLEGQLAINKNQQIALSEQELIDCSENYTNTGCSGGDQYVSFEYIRDHGLSSESDYPYIERDGNCQNKEKVIKTLSQIQRVAQDDNSLAQAIATIGPISVSADASIWLFYGGGIFDSSLCGTDINHAILAVGYTQDYWIIKNSWGTEWGENGYINVRRGKNMCAIELDNSYALL